MKETVLPPVGRVEGLRLVPHGHEPRNHRVVVQYTSPTDSQHWHSLELPLLDALYLLNLLEEMSRQGNFDHLRRPPLGPTQ